MPDIKDRLSKPDFDVDVAKNVRCPLRDGVKLATDIYFPAKDGVRVDQPLPVVLTRTPYQKNNGEEQATYFARRGYVAVMQDVRGRYASEGTFYPFKDEDKIR